MFRWGPRRMLDGMPDPKPCKVEGCDEPKALPKHKCHWHALLDMPIDEQIAEAKRRRPKGIAKWGEHKTRPASVWPAGRRWCSGCNFYVKIWYTQGSRCKACASEAQYSAHILKAYGITYEFYLALYQAQGGKCYICRRQPGKKRLAVDHNHETGEVRGLLCPGSDFGCNAMLGYIRDNVDTARRMVAYLEDPPARALREGRDIPLEVKAATGGTMGGRSRTTLPPASGDNLPGLMARMAEESIEARARRARDGHYTDGDFWRFPKDHAGPFDIFHAVPDKLDPKVWEKRLDLAREKEARNAAGRERQHA
jgi:hypothetical protein